MRFKRLLCLAVLFALMFSMAVPTVTYAANFNFDFVIPPIDDEDSDGYIIALLPPESSTITLKIESKRAWKMAGELTNFDLNKTKWSWNGGKGQSLITIQNLPNTDPDMTYESSICSPPNAKLPDIDVMLYQLSAKDYTTFNNLCKCGSKRALYIGYVEDPYTNEVKRVNYQNKTYHALVEQDRAICCENCDAELPIYAFCKAWVKSFKKEKHHFDGMFCVDCGYERQIPATKVTLTTPSKTVTLGSDIQLTCTMKPIDTNSTLSYASNKPNIATVDASGLVTPHSAGKVTITAKASTGKKASVQLTIVDPKAPTRVVIDPVKPLKLDIGQTVELTGILIPDTAESVLEWKSLKPNIVFVRPAGNEGENKAIVEAKAKGSTFIVVKTANGVSARLKVTVSGRPFVPVP